MVQISAVIMTLNEEKNIERCLLSLQEVADEILVVDSYSTDKTQEICERLGARFVQHPFEGYIEQRTWAVQQATFDHVLAVDADEVVSEILKKSILAVKQNWAADGYKFNRLTNYCGQKWLRHSGWYPDMKLRLWDRRKGYVTGKNPHDQIVVTNGGMVRWLKGDLFHYTYCSINEHITQLNKFTDVAAEGYYEGGKKVSLPKIIGKACWKFFRDYFFKLGFLDGYYGFLVCCISSFHVFLKYAKLKHLYRVNSKDVK